MVFFGKPRTEATAHASESPNVMTVPLMILAGLTILAGTINLPGVHTFGHWLEHTMEENAHAGEFVIFVAALS